MLAMFWSLGLNALPTRRPQVGKPTYNSEKGSRWMPPALDSMPRFS